MPTRHWVQAYKHLHSAHCGRAMPDVGGDIDEHAAIVAASRRMVEEGRHASADLQSLTVDTRNAIDTSKRKLLRERPA